VADGRIDGIEKVCLYTQFAGGLPLIERQSCSAEIMALLTCNDATH